MALLLPSQSQKHRVLTMGAAVWDYFIRPKTLDEYLSFNQFGGPRQIKAIDPILSYADDNKIEYGKPLPGGSALSVSQYFAIRKKENGSSGNLVEHVSALVLLGTVDGSPKEELTQDSKEMRDKFDALGIEVRERRRVGRLARVLYIIHPTNHLERRLFWEGNVEERTDYNLPIDWINQHDTLMLMSTNPDIASRAAKQFDRDYLFYNPGQVLRNIPFSKTKFEEIIPKAHILSLNYEEAEIVVNGLYHHRPKKKNIRKALKSLFNPKNPNLSLIFVTQGAEGAYVLSRKESDFKFNLNKSTFRTDREKIISTVGCGDAFNAGVMEAIWRGFSLPDILKAGCERAQGALLHCGSVNDRFLKPNDQTYVDLGLERLIEP